MQLEGTNIVVTGGGRGIGAAMARRFAQERAATVLVADVDGQAAGAVADEINAMETGTVGVGMSADLSSEDGNVRVIRAAESNGPLDLLCMNAGIGVGGGVEAPDSEWYRIWDINVMAHVWGARAALPGMLERGEGYVLTTASAAGILTNLGTAPYAVTKHAAVALAEWLSITHGDAGVKVSCLCPQGVRTRMLFPELDDDAPVIGGDDAVATESVRMQGVLEPEDVAEAVVRGIDDEQFLILPHPEVHDYWKRKVDDYDRWLAGMRKLQAKLGASS